MEKVAETTSVVVERKAEESAEASEPKADCPGTRKRPAGDVDAQATPDANASEPKRAKTLWACEENIFAFEEACDGIEKEWDRASGEGRELSALFRNTDDWNYGEFKTVAMEFMRVSGERMSKPELKKRYDTLKEAMDKGLGRFDALRQWMREAVEMVRDSKCEEDLLEQMNGLTERLREFRKSDWVWHDSS